LFSVDKENNPSINIRVSKNTSRNLTRKFCKRLQLRDTSNSIFSPNVKYI
jgi:hypothetical protein